MYLVPRNSIKKINVFPIKHAKTTYILRHIYPGVLVSQTQEGPRDRRQGRHDGGGKGEGLSGKRKEMDGVYIIFSDPFFSSNRIAYKTQSILFFFFQKKKGCFARFRFFPSLGFRVVGSKQRRGGGYQLSPRKKGPMPMPSHAVGENSPPREFHRLAQMANAALGLAPFRAAAISALFIASSILGLTSYRNALSTKLPWGYSEVHESRDRGI